MACSRVTTPAGAGLGLILPQVDMAAAFASFADPADSVFFMRDPSTRRSRRYVLLCALQRTNKPATPATRQSPLLRGKASIAFWLHSTSLPGTADAVLRIDIADVIFISIVRVP